MKYAAHLTLRRGRQQYFETSGFPEDGGYHERWIKVKVWRIPIWLPNTPGRRRAVRIHDLHHVLTEYPTTWRGEAEISAWEVGSGGLERFYAGWLLDLMNIAQGVVINPVGVYRGFMRGRQTRNLYASAFNDGLLDSTIGEYRGQLGLDEVMSSPTPLDQFWFAFWVFISIVVYLAAISLPLVLTVVLVSVILW